MSRRLAGILGTMLSLVLMVSACADTSPHLLRAESGGETTVARTDTDAFSQPAANLDTLERRVFDRGETLFDRTWIAAPSDAPHREGLGPLFNAASCSACHARDGRAAPPGDVERVSPGLVMRLSPVDVSAVSTGADLGHQIQDRSIGDIRPEATVLVTYDEVPGTYPDGTPYSLRMPAYRLDGVDRASAVGGLSPRIAPAIVGVGLLEAVPAEVLRGLADPDDRDGDGVSGSLRSVESASEGDMVVGRFGWKAGTGNVLDQVAGAFATDIGITTTLHPDGPCSPSQDDCLIASGDGAPELSDDRLADVVFYASTLAVPGRRNLDDPDVRAGAELFASIGCEACHTAELITGTHPIAALSNQRIHPYTDLLLHDMGPRLADRGSDRDGLAAEWRTPPLWGLGLIGTVNGHTSLLHDGRARSIEEAILWHGGEADASARGFRALDAVDRARVIEFLRSL